MPDLGPRTHAAVAAGILVAGTAVVTAMRLLWPAPDQTAAAYTDQTDLRVLEPFGIDDVTGGPVDLVPGAEGSRTVRLTNPNRTPITVTDLEAVLGPAVDGAHNRVAACPADVVTVVPVDTSVVIPPGTSVEVAMVLRMAYDVPAACADAVFSLTYSGRTTEAG